MKTILVLGAGLIGKTIVSDLKDRFNVTCADISKDALKRLSNYKNVKTVQLDFSNLSALKNLIKKHDLIVSAVPGFMGFRVLKNIISCKKDVVDISFFPEDALELNDLAKANKVRAIVDCGVAPGLCNLMAGYYDSIEPLTDYECLVGGLPKVREWPYEYKAVFSPIDVIEEYTRPARYIENNKMVVREALSDPELINFDEAGTLESFNTDGLRSLAFTMPHVRNMKEKTLRYPGHIALMKIFRETGLFSKNPIDIKGHKIAPLDFTSKLLFSKWAMNPSDRDITVMKVTLKNKKETIICDLVDHYDEKTNTTSMARTTGYTCTAAVNLLSDNKFQQHGVFPPEIVGKNQQCYQTIIDYLKNRNITITKKTIKNKQ